MDLSTKFMLIIAVVYNVIVGAVIEQTSGPLIILLFISIDFFLIFYYLWLLIKQNYGLFQFEKEHQDLIKKAKEELSKS